MTQLRDDQKVAITVLFVVSIILLSIYAIVLGRYGNDKIYDLNLIIIIILVIIISLCFLIIYEIIIIMLSKFKDNLKIEQLENELKELKKKE